MNESEIRRRELLKETRQQSRNQEMLFPAVHPRYGRLYRELYPEDGFTGQTTRMSLHNTQKESVRTGSFTSRLVLSALLFLCFLYVSQNQVPAPLMQGTEIVEMIQKEQTWNGDSLVKQMIQSLSL